MKGKEINTEVKLWPYVKKSDPESCWPWRRSTNSNGYGKLVIYEKATKRRLTYLTHRLVFEECVGPIPEGMVVCHSCDNRICNNPNHLWLGSQMDNIRDRDAKGRKAKPINKLSDIAVVNIKETYDLGLMSTRELGRLYGVSFETVRRNIKESCENL